MESQDTLQMEIAFDPQPGAVLQALEMTCETVLIRGGRTWGNAKLPEKREVLGYRRGVYLERGRLLEVYQKQGINKLLEELKRPVILK